MPDGGMTADEAVVHVTANEPVFALTRARVRGVEMTVFENVPPTVPALLAASWEKQGNGALDYVVYEDETLTFAEFTDEVNRLAHALREELGLRQGDRVALAMRNYPELLVLMLAISSMGGVVVFLNAWWTTEELDFALRDSGAKVVFADGPRMARIDPLRDALGLVTIGVRDGEGAGGAPDYSALRDGAGAETAPEVTIDTDDDFAVMYSSGTTGNPKGVVQTHRGVVNAVFSWLLQSVIAPLVTPPEPGAPEPPRPCGLVVTPLFHVTATHPVFLLSLPAGAKLVLMHKWDAKEAVRLMKEHSVTRFLGVPTQSADLMETALRMKETLPHLTYLGAGGAKRPAAQVGQLAQAFPNAGVATGWGMTETNALGIGQIGDEYIARPDSAGRLHPPVQELRIVDEAGNALPENTLGEIAVKGPQVMRCYLNQPAATAEVLRDGWLRTGDLGMVDAEGYVTILDRRKNIIIRGGENIACLDVEGALHRHPDVLEAVAFSVPDERLGEVVGAAVQLRPGARLDRAGLAAFLDGRIAPFKVPAHLWTQGEGLTRGATDKTDRRAIRAACLARMEDCR
jgi:long-chain acyl-CoA synthetase